MLHEIAERIDEYSRFAEPHRARFGDPESPAHHADIDILQRRRRRVGRERPVAVALSGTADATTASAPKRAAISARTSSRRCASTHVPPISASAAVKRARRSPPGEANSGTSGRGRARRLRRANLRQKGVASRHFGCFRDFSDTTRGRFRRARPAGRADAPRYSAGCTARSSAAASARRQAKRPSPRYSVGLASSRPAIFSTSCFTNGTSWRSAITSRHL